MRQADVENESRSSPAPKNEPDPTPDPTPKKAPKKAANKNGSKKAAIKSGTPKKETKKRAKKEPTPDEESDGADSASSLSEIVPKPKKRKLATDKAKRIIDSDEESAESSEDDFVSSSEEERPRKKAKPAAPKPKRKSNEKIAVDTDTGSPLSELESDKGDSSESAGSITAAQSQPKKVGSDEKSKPTKVNSDNESEMSIVYDEPPKRKPKTKKFKQESEPEPKDGGGSDTSEVFDEPPKKKGKAKDQPAKRGRKAQSATPVGQSPDDALIKQLQGQLVKCGVRKIWGVELKKYGDDKKGKIRHLKNMLTEIGMTGRFSEAKAKEIKERRELMADLDAVMEGEKNWGVNQGRARRGAVKNLKEPSDEESSEQLPEANKEGQDDDDEDSEDAYVHTRGPAKRRADLAFLGDESESD